MIEARVELAASDPVAAEAVARESYETLASFGEHAFRSSVGCYLAEALCQQGLDTEAERIAIEAAAMTSVDDFITHARSLTTRAIVLARRADVEAAHRLAQEAVSLTAESDSFAEHGDTLTALADVLELAGRREDATDLLHEALDRYERKKARAQVHRIRERLAAIQPTQA